MCIQFALLLIQTDARHAVLYAVLGVLLVALLTAAAVAHSLWQFFFWRPAEINPEWLEEFSVARYQGLAKLFDREDFDFLAHQPGFSPELTARLRADRLKIASSYLDRLARDVRQLLSIANRSLATATHDEGDFSAFLLKQEFRFAAGLLSIRFQLFLMRCGLLRYVRFNAVLDILPPLVMQSKLLSAAA
ncbi:MAG TPA: hypothetical protein VN737_21360 [Bryobacteraceae bacterium]|jgi:hypothetical protein|nr:hypothetical protein [Bryobacteraceae bacterium]